MNLHGSIRIRSLGGSSYIYVIVDGYSRITWVIFSRDKIDALKEFVKLCKKLQIFKNLSVVTIRTDQVREFDQDKFTNYYDKNGISQNFSAPRTRWQNGVIGRKNKALEDMVRIVICENDLLKPL